jgi:hypothetical protein
MGSGMNSRGSSTTKPRTDREHERLKPSRAAVDATSSPGPSSGRERPFVGHDNVREHFSNQECSLRPSAHIATNSAIRLARVSGFFTT